MGLLTHWHLELRRQWKENISLRISANSLFDKEIDHESSFALSGVEIKNPAEGTGAKLFIYIKHHHQRVLNDL